MTSSWPGSDWVEVVGFSAYNLGGEPEDWRTVHDAMFQASQVLRTVARDKPFLITQTASGPDGGGQDQWIVDMVEFIDADPTWFVYFNFDKEADWRVWDGFEVSEGWRRAVRSPAVAHLWPLTEWFRPGPIPFSPSPAQPGAAAPPAVDVASRATSPEPAFTGAQLASEPPDRVTADRVRPE